MTSKMNEKSLVNVQNSVNISETYKIITNLIDHTILNDQENVIIHKGTHAKELEGITVFQTIANDYQNNSDTLAKHLEELKENIAKSKEEEESETIQISKVEKINQRLQSKREKFHHNDKIGPVDVERMTNFVKAFEFLQQFSNTSLHLSASKNIVAGYTESNGGKQKYFEMDKNLQSKGEIENKMWQHIEASTNLQV